MGGRFSGRGWGNSFRRDAKPARHGTSPSDRRTRKRRVRYPIARLRQVERGCWRCFENAMTIGVLVEIVRDLRLFEPEVPIRNQFIFGEIAKIEIFLAQEFVARSVHEGT